MFFEGLSPRILEAWREGKADLAVSEAILEEYRVVGDRLSAKFPGVDLGPFLGLLSLAARVYRAPSLPISHTVMANRSCVTGSLVVSLDVPKEVRPWRRFPRSFQ